MLNTLFIILFSTFSFSHESPVNITKTRSDQCGSSNHSGMGSIYTNAYEAEIKLRKQCQKPVNLFELTSYCQRASQEMNYSGQMNISDITAGATNLYFSNYAADILASEIDLTGIKYNSPKCLKRQAGSNTSPHYEARKSAMEPKNMVSAGVLMEIYDGHILSSEFSNYTSRLTETFPLLFQPKSRGEGLAELVEESLGDNFDYDNKDGRSHADIMDAFDTLYSSDDTFKKAVNQSVKKIKVEYGISTRNKLKSICNKSPMEIQKEHPAIFKQAILDMTDDQKLGANNYLCKQKEYYDPSEYDSDCDGESDSEDVDPSDPFSPDGNKSHSGRSMTDPPFSSSYDYDVENKNGVVSLKTSLKFDISRMSPAVASNFKKKVNECNNKLESSMDESFEKLKRENSNYSGKMKTKIDIEFGDYFLPDFSVSECFCSDCRDRVIDPEDSTTLLFIDNYIDHRTCWKDLTEKQKEAVRKVFPRGENRWRNRANAANLNIDVSCRTIKHEILHKFGLPDEYSDRNSYPYNRIACNIMGDYSSNRDAIEGRHIEAIISPEQCK